MFFMPTPHKNQSIVDHSQVPAWECRSGRSSFPFSSKRVISQNLFVALIQSCRGGRLSAFLIIRTKSCHDKASNRSPLRK